MHSARSCWSTAGGSNSNALLEHKDGGALERAAHPVEVADRIRTLNHLLEQSRARA
jgi:hypothetical protein